MEHVTVKDLVLGSGGVLAAGKEETPVAHIRLDSRQVEPGDLFVPLIGERVDGHRFLGQVMEQGAAAVLTSQELALPKDGAGCAVIRVEDTKKALQNTIPAF